MTKKFPNLYDVVQDNRTKLHSKPNVVAVGVGYKKIKGRKTSVISIICSVEKKVPSSQLSDQDLIPRIVGGYMTDVVETGRIKALRTDRVRPAPGGVSIGHVDITAGTLGCLVKRDGKTFILSNNHVLANSNDAKIGDPILQPGTYDGGKYPDDHIANLADFVPISFDGDSSSCPIAKGIVSLLNVIAKVFGSSVRMKAISKQATENLVDAAIAEPINIEDVSKEILEIGTVQGVLQGELGMQIQKSGRTTGWTTDTIDQVGVSVKVQYDTNQYAYFTDQLVAGAMSAGGDSGSAVLDLDNNLIGLLFAGSDSITIINRIENVFSALNINI